MSNLAEVPKLYDSTLLDVPAKLRVLADNIEAGKYGPPGTCVVALMADRLELFAWGPESMWPSAHVVLCAAARQLEQPLLDHGR